MAALRAVRLPALRVSCPQRSMPCPADLQPTQSMSLRYGLDDPGTVFKRKFRWLFTVPGIVADDSPSTGIHCLPHRHGARPSLAWKEYDFQHVSETIYYPFKPDWKPIELILYDLRCNKNPVFDWIRFASNGSSPGLYDPNQGAFGYVYDSQIKRSASLRLLDGCANTLETWSLDNCYPSNVGWGELDMDSSDLVTVEVTLRYDRAYIVD